MLRFHKKLTSLLLVTLLVYSGLSFSPHSAEAVVQVDVRSTILKGPVDQINSNTQNIYQLLNNIWKKESVDDPAAWNRSKDAARQLTGRMLVQVASGFDGSPTFVVNLSIFMQKVQDRTTYQFIHSDDLEGISDAFEFQIRVAVAESYDKQRTYKPKSTIDDLTGNRTQDFFAGTYNEPNYLQVWLESTVGDPYNEPIRAALDAEVQSGLRNLEVLNTEVNNKLDWSEGYLTMRWCTETPTSTGGVERDCFDTQPGSLVKQGANYILGELPASILLQEDEINEGISETFSGLSAQIIGGENGLLGIGSSPLSVNTFGTDGSSSYLDELVGRSGGTGPSTYYNPIAESLKAEIEFGSLQQEVLDEVERIEGLLASSTDQYGYCFAMTLSSDLDEAKTTAEDALDASKTVRQILELLNDAFLSAPDQASADLVLEQYNQLDDQGVFTTEIDNEEFKNYYLNSEFKAMVNEFEKGIATQLLKCIDQPTS
ncbi:hypothetical protein KC722_01090 [Candidatus Kaiserbacteria bacterium]|nr:hypothetical protein [Candidatus Kaiserbacteria bacterium]